MPSPIIIDRAIPEQDIIIAQHFYQLWIDNNIPPNLIRDDWLSKTIEFIQDARSELEFQAFVALVDNKIVGSSSCQLFAGLYPAVLKAQQRNYGYIWNVYVEPNYRRRGIAISLTKAAIEYLKNLNCTKAVLNASPSGKPVYEKLGFKAGNEMVLDLFISEDCY